MRHRLLLATVLALLAAPAASAAAGNGSGQNLQVSAPPLQPEVTLVDGPTPAALPAGVSKRQPVLPTGSVTANCGACITTCWTATARAGQNDWSGHVYLYQHLYWCGNGAAVTYASAYQSYEQDGWYRLDSTGGPWWSGGGIGAEYQGVSGNILWDWSTPLVNFHTTGTTSLNSAMWAWGGVTV